MTALSTLAFRIRHRLRMRKLAREGIVERYVAEDGTIHHRLTDLGRECAIERRLI